ncbi:hypothetical protein GCM10027073_11200 [Streptomyces chlorus]
MDGVDSMRPLDVDEPTTAGPYRLLGRLGAGGMGRVYLGRSAGGRTVAVKIVHPHFALDEEFRARFRREVEAARRVGGAWTAPVLDADPEARVPWVATAYVAGPSLTAAVAHGGPLPAHTVRALGAGLAEALTAVHELGLVHRDVKPSNVLLTLDGPLLIDFGITRAMDGTASLTSTGVSIGSPGYMSPEQILGKGATGAADVFSLGAVLAYAATGEPPFSGDSSAALLYKVVHEQPELGALEDAGGSGDSGSSGDAGGAGSGGLRDLVAACLSRDPGARPTPAEVGRRLAPEGGAARLVAGGWLPGALVEQVSRSAVRLLNLEAGQGSSAGGPVSGPVDFGSPSVDGPPTGSDTVPQRPPELRQPDGHRRCALHQRPRRRRVGRGCRERQTDVVVRRVGRRGARDVSAGRDGTVRRHRIPGRRHSGPGGQDGQAPLDLQRQQGRRRAVAGRHLRKPAAGHARAGDLRAAGGLKHERLSLQ